MTAARGTIPGVKRKAQGLTSLLWSPRRRQPPGTSPGALVGSPEHVAPVVRALVYDAEAFSEIEASDAADALRHLAAGKVAWIDVVGLGDPGLLRDLGEALGLHRLALEDVLNTHQRPKVEVYGGADHPHYFLVARMLRLVDGAISSEQVSLFVGPGFVLTFQECIGDVFEPVRERIRADRGRIRRAGADYLAYALLDAVVDGYFPLLEDFGEGLEALEMRVIEAPDPTVVNELHRARRDLLALRRAVWPLREALNALVRDESPVFLPETRLFLRDCYDHTFQVVDLVETYRDVAGGLMDVFLSSVSNRMNEVMKVLTVISTIFIPLSFLAGLWGMNFDPAASSVSMPELRQPWGYPAALALMALVGGGFVVYFRRRGWVGKSR